MTTKAMSEIRAPGVDFANPPIIETVLGIQFNSIDGFTNAQLGAFWATLDRNEWPIVEDAPIVIPQFETFAPTGLWSRAMRFQLTQDQSTRLQIKNRDKSRLIQIQNGRLHLNWLGNGGQPYPRYEQMREEFANLLDKFRGYLRESNFPDLQPNQWEVTYLNDIAQDTVWKTPADWTFFRPLAVPTINGLIEGESFSGEWHFMIPGQRGRLHVKWQHSKDDEPKGKQIVRLTFTARGPLQDAAGVFEGLDLGRHTIVNSFYELTDDRENYWRLVK